ncbi:energy transducer TonB [Hymenobacter sp. IS2118]|uniref:energy transducer TonB n=1 Tax=Hymenobacter sp. IS2118 TaxID=1505605 RepID=UPI000553912C|nr:TonB family protein [Hymenobacter sp. IS2118]
MKTILLALAATLSLSQAQAQKPLLPIAASTFQLEQGTTAADGQRTGKWNFYTRQQELELTFDYDSSRIAFLRPDTTRYLVDPAGQAAWEAKIMARPPHILGSTDARLNQLQRMLRYPVSALRQQLQGSVLVAYTVDATGHTRDFSIEKSLSPDCDQEVWRALQTLPDNWIPAVHLGRPTAARFFLAVKFEITDEAKLARQKRLEARQAKLVAEGAPLPAPVPGKPRYVSEVTVTAVGVERQADNFPTGGTPGGRGRGW